jgi:cytochrome oxidase Cu insertion factor (SCO1/SenC/PrrC family)
MMACPPRKCDRFLSTIWRWPHPRWIWAVLLLMALGLLVSDCVSGDDPDPFTAQGFVRFEQEPIAPDFTLPELDGTPRSLHDFKGQVVLLMFWATW